jgi:uncharacterized protein (DUF3820 family)
MTDDPKPSNIVPFGKYKGRLIEEVLVDDPAYIEWLTAQDWFRAQFTVLHQVIIHVYMLANFGPSNASGGTFGIDAQTATFAQRY